MRTLVLIGCVVALGAAGADAQSCRLAVTGANCVTAGPTAPERMTPITELRNAQARGAPIRPGTILPRNQYNILLLADYYGLPAVEDGWVYIAVERNIYRVDFLSYRVLELVTDQAASNW